MIKQDLNYIVEQGLHDAVLNEFSIDYGRKAVSLEILTEKEKIYLKLKELKLLTIDKDDDLKNTEIILDCNVLDASELKLFTTSNTSYRIHFGDCEVLTEK